MSVTKTPPAVPVPGLSAVASLVDTDSTVGGAYDVVNDDGSDACCATDSVHEYAVPTPVGTAHSTSTWLSTTAQAVVDTTCRAPSDVLPEPDSVTGTHDSIGPKKSPSNTIVPWPSVGSSRSADMPKSMPPLSLYTPACVSSGGVYPVRGLLDDRPQMVTVHSRRDPTPPWVLHVISMSSTDTQQFGTNTPSRPTGMYTTRSMALRVVGPKLRPAMYTMPPAVLADDDAGPVSDRMDGTSNDSSVP